MTRVGSEDGVVSVEDKLPRIWLVATVWAVLGVLPVMTLGLTVPGRVVVPLAMVLGGLFASLAASWNSNQYARDSSRSRILFVAGVAEVAALGSAGLLLLVLLVRVPLPLVALVIIFAAAVAYSAARATLHLRTMVGRVGIDMALSLFLVLIGLLAVFSGIPLLCSTIVSCHA